MRAPASSYRLVGVLFVGSLIALPRLSTTASHRSPRAELAGVKESLMDADYRGDLAALREGLARARPLASDPHWGAWGHYWVGYAHWRLAINGANVGMAADEITHELQRADEEFDAAIAARADFADALAASSGVNGWLVGRSRAEPERMKVFLQRSAERLAQALALAPDNPRVLWVEGGRYLFSPPQYGGDVEKAEQIYRHGVRSPVSAVPGPEADWGTAENWMSLAFLHLGLPAPDLVAARQEACEALRLQPRWSYVRDVLLPRIADAEKAAENATSGSGCPRSAGVSLDRR